MLEPAGGEGGGGGKVSGLIIQQGGVFVGTGGWVEKEEAVPVGR